MSIEETVSAICDNYCKWPLNTETQADLKEICEKCPLNCLTEGISDKKEQALKLMEHIKDRPCEACEFKVDGNCTKWTCVFDEWLYSFVYGVSGGDPT
jgi:hypothetical protein